jgi:uncharacterized membrane protein
VILAFTLGQPNPFSFGGAHNERFDPQHPGIVRWMRHPVLVVLALWAGLHLLPNGDLAHVIVFGIFGIFAVLGRSLINRRKRREMTPARWHALLVQSMAASDFPSGIDLRWVSLRVVAAVVIYLSLLVFHSLIIGVAVVPL